MPHASLAFLAAPIECAGGGRLEQPLKRRAFRAQPIAGELAWGWVVHYAIGIAFAALLIGVAGAAWTTSPTVLPALAIGVVTVLAPLCAMQPAMGAGFLASRTPTPLKNCLRSVANHALFGLGLYASAVAIARLSRTF